MASDCRIALYGRTYLDAEVQVALSSLTAGKGKIDARVVAVNMGTEPAALDLRGRVLVASDGGGEGEPFGGTLGADRAVLLEPG